MADYIAKTRTNYFRTTDEAKLIQILENCTPSVEYNFEEIDGKRCCSFLCDGTFEGFSILDEDGDVCGGDFGLFAESIKEILPDDEAVIITEIGSEKFNYLSAFCTVITKKEVKTLNLDTYAEEYVRTVLNNPNWNTRMDY